VTASKRALAAISYLPAFELSARHLSFKRAAQELHLTPSAVSQQIRSLESALELKLFRRMPRALALTPAGERFTEVVSDTLERYRRGAEQVLKLQGGQVLRLTTDAFVAHEVLIPALHTFRPGKPAIDLRIETTSKVVDLDREEIDAAIRYGVGPWPGMTSTPLGDVIATAMCAPALIEGRGTLKPAAVAGYPLIRIRDQPDPWQRFSQLFSIRLPNQRLVFDSYIASLRAAEKGLGIAVGVFPMTTGAVLEGRLITPLLVRMRLRARFHFLCRTSDAARPLLGALRDWVCARFAELPPLPEARGTTLLDEPKTALGRKRRGFYARD
jgi:LysR family transcriptional regulator, glycine cleavage system transcriptional activator